MAGHGSNWFSAAHGSVQGSIFLSNDAIAHAGFVTAEGQADKSSVADTLHAYQQRVVAVLEHERL